MFVWFEHYFCIDTILKSLILDFGQYLQNGCMDLLEIGFHFGFSCCVFLCRCSDFGFSFVLGEVKFELDLQIFIYYYYF